MSRAKSKSETDSSMEYQMNHKKRGQVLVFNHKKFNNEELTERCGTEKDKESLKASFEALGFEVKSHDDKPKVEVLDELHKAASGNHSDADCFVCIFLTYGKEKQIHAFDELIYIKDITDLFRGNECKSLVGKPKIFIFQACPENKKERDVTGMAAGDSSDDDDDDDEKMKKAAKIFTIPAGADFLMCYSAAEGFCPDCPVDNGSFYIQDLCETLQQHGSSMEFTELLTLVNLKVSQRNVGSRKQMPCFTSLLTKKLYFRQNLA